MNRATRVISSLGIAISLVTACASPTPTPTPAPTATPTPTPTATATATPFPIPAPVPLSELPALTLPADESPHTYLVEWWYFNAHLTSEKQERYALHDVVFRIREPSSGIAAHVRHIGLGGGAGGYAHTELFQLAAPVETAPPGRLRTSGAGHTHGGRRGRVLHAARRGWRLRVRPRAPRDDGTAAPPGWARGLRLRRCDLLLHAPAPRAERHADAPGRFDNERHGPGVGSTSSGATSSRSPSNGTGPASS